MSDIRNKVLLVDDNLTNLSMGKNILKNIYEVYTVSSAQRMFSLLEKIQPDLILLDIEMPEMNGYEAIKKLKSDSHFADIPVIFVTARSDEGSEMEGLSLGAIDYIYKPFSGALIIQRIKNHLITVEQRKTLERYNHNLESAVREKSEQVHELKNTVITSIAEMVESRDNVTGNHIMRTQAYLKLLLDELVEQGIYSDVTRGWNFDFLFTAAQLHDVGKISISDTILNKPDRLTAEEFEIMKTHALLGVKIINSIEGNTREHEFLRHAKTIAGTHHEKWDGTGYPYGLKGREIPLEGRLMAIADVYDALISVRPYKEALPIPEAERIIVEGAGSHFDPVLVGVFQTVASRFAHIAQNYRDSSPEGETPHTPLERARVA
ncbi:MAG: response regulator [Coriobacteriales bacterium]|jgi:putative two-component system response regulator|nr:response regulator [Coriobacteriales bacterium]